MHRGAVWSGASVQAHLCEHDSQRDQTQIIEAVTGRCEMAIEQDALTVSTRPGLQVLRQGPAWPLKRLFPKQFRSSKPTGSLLLVFLGTNTEGSRAYGITVVSS